MGEQELRERLLAEGLEASSWGNAPQERYSAHRHAYDKVLVVAAGSITFHLPELGQDVRLDEGDRLDLPAQILHAADVGDAGVSCLEAHRPAGSLGDRPDRLLDWRATES